MSDGIKVSDLVMVVRWPCCGSKLGHVHVVHAITPEAILGGYCADCGAEHCGYGDTAEFDNGRAAPIIWLRKLPPLAKPEDVKRDEEITA